MCFRVKSSPEYAYSAWKNLIKLESRKNFKKKYKPHLNHYTSTSTCSSANLYRKCVIIRGLEGVNQNPAAKARLKGVPMKRMLRYAHTHTFTILPPYAYEWVNRIASVWISWGVSYCNISGGGSGVMEWIYRGVEGYGLKAVTCIMDWNLSVSHKCNCVVRVLWRNPLRFRFTVVFAVLMER